MAIQINGKKVVHLGSMTIPIIKGDIGPEGKQGKQGVPGNDGKDGQTPLRGIDYWTQADKDAIKQEIYAEIDPKLEGKVEKEQGKGLSTNDFTNILKEKLENLENYNDTEIRNLLNGSLKNVNYTASNGMLTFTKNDGSTISVDLPLELLIESGRYDEANKQIVLVLANGNSINIPVSSLLDDFYGKNETYNKTEVDTIIAEKQALIDKLEEENQKQQEELDILNSEYTEKELEGESVVISNGLPKSKIKVKGNGNSYQETTEGYNLIDTKSFTVNYKENAVTVNINKDGDINLNIETSYISFNVPSLVLPAGTYTFVRNFTANHNSSLKDSENNSVLGLGYGQKYKTVTLESEKTITKFEGGLLAGDNYFWLYEGSYDANKPYEPYTNGVATPNTNHKQDIEVITECSLVQRGKNLINDEQYKGKNIVTSFFSNINENKLLPTEYQFKKDKFYKFNVLFTDGTMVEKTDWNLVLAFYDINKTQLTSIPVYGAYDIASKSLDGVKYIKVVTNSIGEATYEGKTIQAITLVELDNSSYIITLEDFEEYKYELTPIDLAGNKLAKVGEIADILKIGVDGSVSIGGNTIIEKITSSNNIVKNEYGTNSYKIVTTKHHKKSKNEYTPELIVISNYFKGVPYTSRATDLNTIIYDEYNDSRRVTIRNTPFTTIEELKAFLDNNDVYVVYVLDTPEVINLPSIEPIELFEGTNVFELVTNLGTTLAVTYKVSNKKKILNLEERIAALESAVIGG